MKSRYVSEAVAQSVSGVAGVLFCIWSMICHGYLADATSQGNQTLDDGSSAGGFIPGDFMSLVIRFSIGLMYVQMIRPICLLGALIDSSLVSHVNWIRFKG